VFTQKRGIFLDATLSACLVELTGTHHITLTGTVYTPIIGSQSNHR
jgi:hypothetical protein